MARGCISGGKRRSCFDDNRFVGKFQDFDVSGDLVGTVGAGHNEVGAGFGDGVAGTRAREHGGIFASAAGYFVVARAAIEHVVARAAVEQVVACAAVQFILAVAAKEDVVTGQSGEGVGGTRTRQDVFLLGAPE